MIKSWPRDALIVVTVTCFFGRAAAADERVAVDPMDVEVTVELVGSAPLPFQGVRLRMRIRNISNKRLGPLVPVDYRSGALRKEPEDRKSTRVNARQLDSAYAD